MFYKLLGMAVWKGAKWYLGRRVPVSTGTSTGTKALIVGGVLALGVGAAALSKRSTD
jgi:hypothetical protein